MGDLNGDGFDDWMISALLSDAGGYDAGRVYVYWGGPQADARPDLVLTGETAGDCFGATVAKAGDVNGDGFVDLLVGAPFDDAAGTDAGRVYVYFGGPEVDAIPDLTLDGPTAGGDFGNVSSARISGDGFDDIVVGSPCFGTSKPTAGRVYVYECKRYFVLSPNGGDNWSAGGTATVSWLGSQPADLWLALGAGAPDRLLVQHVGGKGRNSVPVHIPNLATLSARILIKPASSSVSGSDASDSPFTIH